MQVIAHRLADAIAISAHLHVTMFRRGINTRSVDKRNLDRYDLRCGRLPVDPMPQNRARPGPDRINVDRPKTPVGAGRGGRSIDMAIGNTLMTIQTVHVALAGCAAFIGLAGCSLATGPGDPQPADRPAASAPTAAEVTSLADSIDPLQAYFDGHVDRVRFLALLSPT